MRVDLSIWDKLNRLVVFLLFVSGLIGVAVWYLPLIKQNAEMRRRILQLDAQVQKAEEHGKELKVSIDSLRLDSKAIERLARERLGYAKPGETVIRFVESTNSAGPVIR